jgi:hypothetical protein
MCEGLRIPAVNYTAHHADLSLRGEDLTMKKHYDFHVEHAKNALRQAAEKLETVDQVLMFAQVNAQLATAAMLDQIAHEMSLDRSKR